MEEKKIKGRKRHVATDSQGNILHIKVHAANIHDTIAGVPFLQETFNRHPLNGSRRLAKDYEICAKYSENFIRIAHAFLLLRRVAIS
jgi:Transposase DDE domain